MANVKLISQKGFKIVLPEPTAPPTVEKSINWERKQEEGATDYVQEYKGFDIPIITLEYELATDDWSDGEKDLKNIKKVYEHIEDGKPPVWTITEPFINLCGVKKVVCKDLSVKKVSEYVVKTVLKFEEYKPKVVDKEKKTSAGKTQNLQNKTKTAQVKNPCEKHGFSDRKCREYYYRYRLEKEKGLTNASFEVWLSETIKKEGKPISADE